MESHYGFLNRGKQCLMETIPAAVWRREAGTTAESSAKQGTIEMEMRVRGVVSIPRKNWQKREQTGSRSPQRGGQWEGVPGPRAFDKNRNAGGSVAI